MFAVKSDVKPTFYGTPTIYITESAARFMKKLVDKVSMEVGWLMVCHETDEGDFVLSECIVPGQQCHQTTTELLPEGLEEVIMELIEEDTAAGIATNSDEFRCNHLNAWFHSHDTMGVSPSGQDDQQMTDFCTRYDDAYNVWIRGIVNKAGDIHVTIYYKTSKVWKVVAGCPVEIAWDNEDDDSLSTLVDDTVRSRVKRFGGTTLGGYRGGHNHQPYSGHLISGRTRQRHTGSTINSSQNLGKYGAHRKGNK